jgi:hypothetical protein
VRALFDDLDLQYKANAQGSAWWDAQFICERKRMNATA